MSYSLRFDGLWEPQMEVQFGIMQYLARIG